MSETNTLTSTFFTPEEQALSDQFLARGHVILPVEELDALDRIRQRVAELAAAHLGVRPSAVNAAVETFLDTIADRVRPDQLNELRLEIFHTLNEENWFRPAYYSLARRTISTLVGNELAMQRRINLSIQMPGDETSLQPLHADVWSGDSAFETVVWLPLVDCHHTKSMFLLPPEKDAEVQSRLAKFKGRSVEDLFAAVESDLIWIDIKYGEVLLFNQNLMHGNRVNRESTTRWSMNCRFKSLLSPYADKRLGEFFEPITIRPATRIGMNYRLPSSFNE